MEANTAQVVKEAVVTKEAEQVPTLDQELLKKAMSLAGAKLVNLALQTVITKYEKTETAINKRKKIIKINFDKGTIALVNLEFAWIDKSGKRQIFKTLVGSEERKEELSRIRGKLGITRYDENDKPVYMNTEGKVIVYPPVAVPEVSQQVRSGGPRTGMLTGPKQTSLIPRK